MTVAIIDGRSPRKKLGALLFQNYKSGNQYTAFDFEKTAADVGLTPQELEIEIRTLRIAGLVDHTSQQFKFDKRGKRVDGGPFPWEAYWKVWLTDNGILWADQKFPPIQVPGTSNIAVTVDIQVAISQTIKVIQEVDDATKEQRDRVELLLRRLDDELKKPKGKGKFTIVKDLIETAAASKSLLGPVIRTLNEHWPEIEGLTDLI